MNQQRDQLPKPHALKVYAATETPDGTTLGVSPPAFAATFQTVRGQLSPKTPGSTFQSHGVMLDQPHLFSFDVADIGKIGVGYKLTLGARVFIVKTFPARYDTDPDGDRGITNHASCIVNEEQELE